ncbi:hypothetical protein A2cp1_1308 [Anaeromyxobacter dehalogenans 2CP-1]|uniref:DUF3168 domain-containing protein n=1 Tax=Anaeromyxobacter dehalogenans (strain ATCC BAA-258 / DSM 21875 / 2CP-1) TaxID=455488 RepID=B8JGI1_ANAD2|nr:hypothetical protein [Anaeromyxobacter dehalogenans]ACL64652.1 hypothetical protein A2cp1_1308 [Anaeromyxobacter dehalogenans 2CP-1]
MTNSHEQIFAAVFARLSGALTGAVTSGRRVRSWEEVGPEAQPAFFLEQLGATLENAPPGPSRQTVRASALFYVHSDTADGPMPLLNSLVAIATGSLVEARGIPTTLGGLVASARPTDITYGGGNLGAQGIAAITIEMRTA